MNEERMKTALESVARRGVPENTNLWPRIAARIERKTIMQTLRAKPALLFLVLLLALTLLTGVAYAIGKSLGYIPGIGLVDQSAPIRVLAEPVSVTRDGITLTVEQAILTADKTVVVYKVEGIPSEARPKGESGFACHPTTPTLLLPDGTKLNMNGSNGSGWGTGYRTGMNYLPIPADVDTVTFLLPCLEDVAPAAAPQDWELTLRFVPAPPDLTIVPIIEIATPLPTPTAPASVSLAESDSFMGLTYHLESMKRTEQGYILETSIRWEDGLYADFGVGTGAEITLTDANGKTIDLHWSQDEKYRLPVEPRRGVMGHSMDDGSFTAPLTITLPWVGANLPLESKPQFTFDPGANPQPGQEWQINQTIEVLGHSVKIISARYVTRDDLKDQEWMRFMLEDIYGFEFTLEADPAFRSIALAVQAGYSADGGGTSGTPTVRDENGIIKSYAMMGGKIISPLTIAIPYVDIAHQWQITFNPADVMTIISMPSSSSFDISLQIEKVIPIDDGYYLIGRTIWNDPRLSEVGIGGGWDTRLLDANGMEYPIEPAYFDEIGITGIQPGQWAYKVYGKALPTSLTLKMTQANVQFIQPYTFTFDPGANPQLGQEWQINQPLEILGYKATIQSAKFVQQGDLHGFEFSLIADPALQGIPLNMESGITGGYAGGGGASPRDINGVMKVYALSDGQFTGPILLTIRGAVLSGDWETTWNPPVVDASITPTPIPQACITLNEWKKVAASADAGAIPRGMPERVMVTRGALAPEPSMFFVNLDGTDEQPVAFGNPISLTPDKAKLIYSGADGQTYTFDIASGQISRYEAQSVVWSPDGKKYAFAKQDEYSKIYIANADGTNLHPLTQETSYEMFMSWTPDSQSILYVTSGQKGDAIKVVNAKTGAVESLFTTNKAYFSHVALSSDGKWVAYVDRVVGKMAPGIYLSRLDGEQKRLLFQLDYWMAIPGIWSPDGKWLIVNVINTDSFLPDDSIALVNVETCQVVAMPWLKGGVHFWVQP